MTRHCEAVGREPGDVPDHLIIKGPLTLEQVGRLLGVSRERVRQIEGSAMRKLLDGLRSIGIDAPESILEVHTDRLADLAPKKFARLPMKRTKPGGATAAARCAMERQGIVNEAEPRTREAGVSVSDLIAKQLNAKARKQPRQPPEPPAPPVAEKPDVNQLPLFPSADEYVAKY